MNAKIVFVVLAVLEAACIWFFGWQIYTPLGLNIQVTPAKFQLILICLIILAVVVSALGCILSQPKHKDKKDKTDEPEMSPEQKEKIENYQRLLKEQKAKQQPVPKEILEEYTEQSKPVLPTPKPIPEPQTTQKTEQPPPQCKRCGSYYCKSIGGPVECPNPEPEPEPLDFSKMVENAVAQEFPNSRRKLKYRSELDPKTNTWKITKAVIIGTVGYDEPTPQPTQPTPQPVVKPPEQTQIILQQQIKPQQQQKNPNIGDVFE